MSSHDNNSSVRNPLYDRLLPHVDHQIEVASYGATNDGPLNVAVECIECGEVLIDADQTDTLEEDDDT